MLKMYASFTVLASILSFFCLFTHTQPYETMKDTVYTNLCTLIKSKIIHLIFLEQYLSCVSSEDPLNDSLVDVDGLYTAEELRKFSGTEDEKRLYLSILGEVFDVTKGQEYYAPGKGYHGFVGKDGSRAFVTGKFTEEGLVDDVLDLSHSDLVSLREWMKFYHETYKFKGKLIGRYYDEEGKPTGYFYKLQQKLAEAEKQKTVEEEIKMQYPPCNVDWDANTGSRVWCSQRSGGIERDWVGVPRKLYEIGSKQHRCACINNMGQSTDEDRDKRIGNIEEYEDCHPAATSCHVVM
ncbi:neuferricin [Nilaparvata lugens]|uniref:neuferricin n=1 Tax=Nilaparvata lugens TaxID=108931 RepID=UPI000B98172F|nr:neuferricin [Nilaparvata lugens]